MISSHFLQKYLTWKHPLKDYNLIECLILNFGSQQKIRGLSMFPMEIDFNSEIFSNLNENEAADNCFLVFIGGNYIQILEQVMEKVKTISKKIGIHPLGLFISVDNNSQFKNYAVGADFPLVIVKFVCILPFYIIQYLYFKWQFFWNTIF